MDNASAGCLYHVSFVPFFKTTIFENLYQFPDRKPRSHPPASFRCKRRPRFTGLPPLLIFTFDTQRAVPNEFYVLQLSATCAARGTAVTLRRPVHGLHSILRKCGSEEIAKMSVSYITRFENLEGIGTGLLYLEPRGAIGRGIDSSFHIPTSSRPVNFWFTMEYGCLNIDRILGVFTLLPESVPH